MARILITDDEAPVRDSIAAALASVGHTVMAAKSAREALKLHAETPADLIITDLAMRDMDGIELLRRVRSSTPQTPVIAISGHRHGTIWLNMAKMVGADRILAKPFSMQELADAVSRVLSGPSAA